VRGAVLPVIRYLPAAVDLGHFGFLHSGDLAESPVVADHLLHIDQVPFGEDLASLLENLVGDTGLPSRFGRETEQNPIGRCELGAVELPVTDDPPVYSATVRITSSRARVGGSKERPASPCPLNGTAS
jgi:hypothetical protein